RCYDKYCQAVAKELGTDLTRDADRVWLESYSRYFKDLRAEGSQRRGSFFLGGNYPELPYQRAVTDKLDLSMVEQVWLGAARILWPGGVWTGYYPAMPNQKVLNNRTEGTSEARSFNNLWVAQLAYAMRGDRGVHLPAGAAAGRRRGDSGLSGPGSGGPGRSAAGARSPALARPTRRRARRRQADARHTRPVQPRRRARAARSAAVDEGAPALAKSGPAHPGRGHELKKDLSKGSRHAASQAD